ncbi:YIP1 family protein [Belnapia sp. T6]|uniref:YIP1 family protein n=1 Tax=Belnapia mucosa TaxID=2804532 RepID=A0ABS1V8Z3_9PROT|nr:YIP1 family protein [Belnapia mucosa]MBL6458140.1 YIP1 family protein [Belnapia mucosa]
MALFDRAKALLLRPEQEWRVIAAEPADTASLFKTYAAPLSALPAVAGFIGAALFAGMLGGMVGARIGIFGLLVNAITGYLLGLAALWVWGKVLEALSPRFGGLAEEVPAMKLAVHTPTAIWLAGLFAIIPPLAILGILGLVSIYTFYKGAPVVMLVPRDRVGGFTLAAVVIGFLVNLVLGLLASLVFRF